MRRSRTALFEALARRPAAGSECSRQQGTEECDSLAPDPYVPIPNECRGARCSTGVFPEYTFSSSRPDVANFVEHDPASLNPRNPLLVADKPVARRAVGAALRLQRGDDDGHRHRRRLLLLAEGDRAGGDRPAAVRHRAAGGEGDEDGERTDPGPRRPRRPRPPPGRTPAPIPPPPPGPTVVPTTPTPVPAPAPTPTPHAAPKPAPPAPLPAPYVPTQPAQTPVVPFVPPPPTPAFQPTPPSGTSPVSAVEREEEEEEAYESSSAFSAVRPHRAITTVSPLGSEGGGGSSRLMPMLRDARRDRRRRRRRQPGRPAPRPPLRPPQPTCVSVQLELLEVSMNNAKHQAGRRDPVSYAALIVAVAALVFAVTGQAPAGQPEFAAHASQADEEEEGNGGGTAVKCPVSPAVTFGSWCLESSPHPIPASAVGQNDYFYATQTCVKEGGWLPSAAQLIGAAPEVALQSTIDDNPATSGAEEFPKPTAASSTNAR